MFWNKQKKVLHMLGFFILTTKTSTNLNGMQKLWSRISQNTERTL